MAEAPAVTAAASARSSNRRACASRRSSRSRNTRIVILSAKFSLGLETWLKESKYQIPEGAAALLQPYVQNGSKFFVARVDAKKAKFENGQLVLSPLRFHYDSEQFSLPVRLGLVNSGGTQDLIVHVVAKDRYELANGKNVFVPTNIDVSSRAGPQFGGFYKELLERTFKKNPGAAVTEFAWKGALPPPTEFVQSGIYGVTCDPCPPPHPVDNPLARYLGVDLLPNIKTDDQVAAFAQASTLTRIHLRYGKDSAPDDLVFKIGKPMTGGVPDVIGVKPDESNRFQGRYLMHVEGCGTPARMFTPTGGPLSGASADSTIMVDPFEQIITSEITELGIKPVALAKDPKPLPEMPPPPPMSSTFFMNSMPSARSNLVFDTPTVSGSGKLDPELVKKVMSANRGQLRYCYESALMSKPTLSGRVVFEFEVDARGTVTSSSVVAATLPDTTTHACMSGRIRTWMFPKPRGGNVKVKTGVTFSR
ncbi:MAG: DUF2330 domain-containing protein [Archangium sp.]